jgi:hypothetical protein
LARGFSSLPYWRLRAGIDCAESAANAKVKDSAGISFSSFREIGIPENIPVAVYDYYGSQAAYKGFSFLPHDEYSKVLCDDPDDLDEDALAVLKRLGMVLLPEYILKQRGDEPIKTLRDMILWLDWVRQHQPVAEENSPAIL